MSMERREEFDPVQTYQREKQADSQWKLENKGRA